MSTFNTCCKLCCLNYDVWRQILSGAIHSLLPSDGPTPICHLSSCVRGWSTKHNEEHPAAYWSSTDSAHDHPKESGFILIVTEIFPRGIFHVVYHISVFGFMSVNCWREKWSHWDVLHGEQEEISVLRKFPCSSFTRKWTEKEGNWFIGKRKFFQTAFLTTVWASFSLK